MGYFRRISMNRKTKRERLRRVRRAMALLAHLSGASVGLMPSEAFRPAYSRKAAKNAHRRILDAWRLGHGRLPSSLASYRYKVAKLRERAKGVGVSFGRNAYHRHDMW